MTTFEKVRELINDVMHIEEDKITLESNLFTDLGFDSIEAFELVAAIEEEFGATVSDEDAETLKTVKNIVDYIDSHK